MGHKEHSKEHVKGTTNGQRQKKLELWYTKLSFLDVFGGKRAPCCGIGIMYAQTDN